MRSVADAVRSSTSAANTLRGLRYWADLLDSRYRIPGTSIRFGLDPILSLIPGVGDLTSPIFTIVLLVQGVRQHIPRVVMIRMVINAFLDALIGMVPIAGSIGDIFWRANNMNLALLERHAQPGRLPSRNDYAFVWIVAIFFALALLVPVLLGLWFTLVIWELLTH